MRKGFRVRVLPALYDNTKRRKGALVHFLSPAGRRSETLTCIIIYLHVLFALAFGKSMGWLTGKAPV